MNRFKKRNIYVHHYASHTQSQNILSTENPYEDRYFMLTKILTNWIMATALRVAKMLPKATKYPLFWSWQKSPAYCTYQFKRKKYVQIRLFFPKWTYHIFQGIWTYIHTGMMHVIKMHMPATDVQVLVKVKKAGRVRCHPISMYMYNIWTTCLFCPSGD